MSLMAEPSTREAELHQALTRFPAGVFQFDARMASGWLSDRYFVRTSATLAHAGRDPEVTLQIFAKKGGVLAGVYEALRLLQTQLADGYEPGQVTVDTLLEGDAINAAGSEAWETVMHVHGAYRAFGHLETPLLGVLARRSLVATNTRAVVEAAAGKPVIFMAPRHDDWRVQTPDGYAAQVGGARSVSSDAAGAWWGARGVGTMPHAMIAAFGGDTVAATLAFARYLREHEPDVQVMSLVDYENNAVRTSLEVARAMRAEFGPGSLAAVRVDTSERLIDDSLIDDPEVWGRASLTGVNAHLVRKMRSSLDAGGFPEVGIVVSGGFKPDKIRQFEAEGVPTAAYGVGSSLLGHSDGSGGLLSDFDFTADVVRLDGAEAGKVGRRFRENPRMVRLDWSRAG
ncbi:MAG: Nicotinate phosphoribosyltransferase [uncultured Gemmatimonadetes bacterium]|uniref:Nicotinate phosphoribosyltransferase n=1 Tax=uncultured Gemmatimonadota bacterium TaxID=203437 RepID=A0A6J4L2X8_9BACT|nr:MAG: Nicotinate phosphoribosyltransferase [uncultured Gemmatimonadota bacterium]